MTPVSLISHRLLAAAAGQPQRPVRKPARSPRADWPGRPLAALLDFELLRDDKVRQGPASVGEREICMGR